MERRDLFDRDEQPFANDRDVITEVLDLVQHVRRQEHGAALGGDLTDELLELVLDERVEPRSRLVQDQELGLMHERLDERDLLSVPRESSRIGRSTCTPNRVTRPSSMRASTPPRRRPNQVNSSRAVMCS